ncbi:MAG: division/cell wall cluster transcriptional repressor MraZ [Anaerolineaceae bacterium]|nr:division/cell wall cluster transcriptional repressor MraZ [Anaerolineaceae bacterium]
MDQSGLKWDAGYNRRPGLYPKVGQMFFGQFEHSIDEKGRITIPAQYRNLFDTGTYITRGFDENLMIMRTEEFNSLYQKVRALSITNPTARNLARLIFANAAMLELDKAGRILIPRFLREAAKLNRLIKLVGIGPYLEIWSLENWGKKQVMFDDGEERTRQFESLNITF